MPSTSAMKDDRIANLLTAILLQLMKGSTMADKIAQLSVVGYTNIEIADILQTTAGAVGQALYAAKTGKKKKVNAES